MYYPRIEINRNKCHNDSHLCVFTFVTSSMYGYLPPSCSIRAPNINYPSPYLPYFASGGGGKYCGILEDRSANISKYPREVTRY